MTSSEAPPIGSKQWIDAFAEKERKSEQQYKANHVRPGGTLTVGSVKIGDVSVAKTGEEYIVAARVTNRVDNLWGRHLHSEV